MTTLTSLVDYIPQWLMKGLTIAGKMLPAIGFAMILATMVKKEVIPFAILGYVLAAYFKLPVIGIALVGTIFALNELYNKPKVVVETTETNEGGTDDWI